MQRGNLVVKRYSALVETSAGITEQALQEIDADLAVVFSQIGGVFQQVEQTPAIAISRQ